VSFNLLSILTVGIRWNLKYWVKHHSTHNYVYTIFHPTILVQVNARCVPPNRPSAPWGHPCRWWAIPLSGCQWRCGSVIHIHDIPKSISGPLGSSPLFHKQSPVRSHTFSITWPSDIFFISLSPLYTLIYDMLCSTLVLVPLHRYLCAVCTALAFIPPVCSSSYCTFRLSSYSSAPPTLLIWLLLHIKTLRHSNVQ